VPWSAAAWLWNASPPYAPAPWKADAMTSELLRLADAVVTVLNAGPLSQAFIAERLYVPQFELPDLKVLHVTVVPKDEDTKPLTRSTTQRIYRVDVGVQKKFEKGDAAELDPLVALVSEIAALFRGKRLAAVPEAICTVTKPEPIYSPEHMEQFRQFTSVLTLTFKVS
jgi:hypothetical protein